MVEGYTSVLKTIIKFKPDLEMEVHECVSPNLSFKETFCGLKFLPMVSSSKTFAISIVTWLQSWYVYKGHITDV